MKTVLIAFFFFLLFAFATKAEFVYDTDGEPLRNSGKYYFSPPDPIGSAEVTFAALGGNGECPIAVVQKSYIHGWPTVIGTPLKVPFISTDFPLIIEFADFPKIPPCTATSSKWVVLESLPVGATVNVGDYPVNSHGWFFIKPHGIGSYKLVFCSNDDAEVCGDIGARLDGEKNWRLVVTDKDALEFKFRKAEESFASDISMVV